MRATRIVAILRIYDQNIASRAQFRYHFVVQFAPASWTIHFRRLSKLVPTERQHSPSSNT